MKDKRINQLVLFVIKEFKKKNVDSKSFEFRF